MNWKRWLGSTPWLKAAAAMAMCLVGVQLYLSAVEPRYPIRHWLAWDLLQVWGWAFAVNILAVCLGATVLLRGLRLRDEPPLRALLFAAAIGLPALCCVMYVAGALSLFGPWLSISLPIVCVALGGRDAWAIVREVVGYCQRVGPPSGPLTWLAVGWGAFCIGLLYLQCMTPDAINYDAGWYHLPIAEDYAREGRLVPFYGEHNRAFPHLASLLHTIGFSAPGLIPQLKWMVALHLEFSVVMWKIVGALVGAQWLLNDRGPRGLWVGFFLFPSLFVYDQNIGGSSDHFLGFFAAPAFVATALCLKRFERRYCALLGMILGGAVLTKYQALYAVVSCGGLLAARWIYCGISWLRSRRKASSPVVPGKELLVAAGLVAGFALLVSAPHFIKNQIYYSNPLHPFAQDLFGSDPSHEKSALWMRVAYANKEFVPQGSLLEKLVNAVRLFFTFSFEPHYSFTKNYPAMGGLFTLLLPCIVLVKGRPRLAVGIAAAFLGIATWALTYTGDRYLQGQITVPIAVALALMVRVWELGVLARLGLSALVATQVVWGADAMFYSGNQRLKSSVELIRSGFKGRRSNGKRYPYRSLERRISKATPKDAVILARNYKILLGINRTVLSDIQTFQNVFFYEKVTGPRALYDMYKAQGVTHLLYKRNARSIAVLQGGFAFADFVYRYAKNEKRFKGLRLVEMPKKPPPPDPERFLVLRPRGWFNITQLSRYSRVPAEHRPPDPKPLYPYSKRMPASELNERMQETRGVLVMRKRKPARALKKIIDQDFVLSEKFKRYSIYLRKELPQ